MQLHQALAFELEGLYVLTSNLEDIIFHVKILLRKFSREEIEEFMHGVCLYIYYYSHFLHFLLLWSWVTR
jgi:hypothetical protein